MRIISQAGLGMNCDIPYEEAVLKRYGEVILCASKHLDREVTIAMYSTEAKALRALELFRGVYIGYIVEKIYHEGTCDCMPIFQFPKDEEIEIENQQAVGKD